MRNFSRNWKSSDNIGGVLNFFSSAKKVEQKNILSTLPEPEIYFHRKN